MSQHQIATSKNKVRNQTSFNFITQIDQLLVHSSIVSKLAIMGCRRLSSPVVESTVMGINLLAAECHYREPSVDEVEPVEYFRDPPSNMGAVDEYFQREDRLIKEQFPDLNASRIPSQPAYFSAMVDHFEREGVQYLQETRALEQFENLSLPDSDDGADEPAEYFHSPVLPASAPPLTPFSAVEELRARTCAQFQQEIDDIRAARFELRNRDSLLLSPSYSTSRFPSSYIPPSLPTADSSFLDLSPGHWEHQQLTEDVQGSVIPIDALNVTPSVDAPLSPAPSAIDDGAGEPEEFFRSQSMEEEGMELDMTLTPSINAPLSPASSSIADGADEPAEFFCSQPMEMELDNVEAESVAVAMIENQKQLHVCALGELMGLVTWEGACLGCGAPGLGSTNADM